MEANKVFMAILYGGECVNVQATDIVDAAVKAGEEYGKREIFEIVDIPG